MSYIDGLRGIAALGVLTFHSTGRLRNSLGADDPWVFLGRLGTNGVELFFVLSGFCLAYPVLTAHARGVQSFDLVRYWAHRLVRIVPPYWAAIALLSGAYFLAGRQVFVHEPGMHDPTMRDVLAQLFFWDYGTTWLSGTFWTLAIEMRWYVAFPFIVALWLRSPLAAVGLAGASLIMFQVVPDLPPDLFALPAFVLGIAAAALAQKRIDSRIAGVGLLVALTVTLTAERLIGPARMPAPHLPADVRLSFPVTFTMWQFVAFALVVYVCSAKWPQRLLSSPPLLFAGAISYSLYLIHLSWVLAARDTFAGLPPAAMSAVMITSGLVGGSLFWWIFERPLTTTLKEAANAHMRSFLGRIVSALRLPTILRMPPTDNPAPLGEPSFSQEGKIGSNPR